MNQDTETEATEESETTRCAQAVAMDSWVPGALEKALASMPVEPPPETPAPEAVHPGGDGNPGQAPGISSLEPAGSQTALVRVDHSADLARPSSPGGQLPPSLLETLRPLPTPTDAAPPSSPSSAPTNSTASPSATAFSLSSFTPVQPQPWLTASGVSASGANESEAPGLALMGMEALSAATASEQSPETVAQPDARDKATEPVSPANGVEAGTSAAGVEGTMRQNSELNSGMDDRAGRHASGETIGSVEVRPLSAAAMAHVRDLRVALQARERGDSAADAIFTNPLEARMSAASTFDTESLVLAPAAAQPAAAVKQEILSRVMEIRSQGSGSMNVVLRPDPNTQLSVQLRSHAGGVQVMVTMERGDATHLRGAWDSLQQSLAQQGVQLSNLEVNRAAIGESLLRAAPAAGPSLDRLAAQGSSQNAFAGSDAEANSGRHGRMADWAYQDNPGASPWMDRRSGGSSNSDLSETTSSSLATRASRRESRNDAAESASVAPQAINHLETWA